jgi:hypothetical protein
MQLERNNKPIFMKKQNVINKLTFNKAAVTELNTTQLHQINGGSSSGCLCDAIVDVITEVVDKIGKPQISL